MLEKMIPQLSVNSIYEIDLAALKKQGVKGIIADLDNTLVGAKVAAPTQRLIAWLKQLSDAGFKLVIVSNNNKARVASFAGPINIPFLPRAKKPIGSAFAKALAIMKLPPEQTVVIGDQLLTDVLGGNRMGLYTILVRPVDPNADGLFTKMNRKIEKIVLSALKKRGYMPWEDS